MATKGEALMPQESDASLRRRLRREIARMNKVDASIADRSQRSFHLWVAKKMTKPARPLKNDVIGWLWRHLTNRA